MLSIYNFISCIRLVFNIAVKEMENRSHWRKVVHAAVNHRHKEDWKQSSKIVGSVVVLQNIYFCEEKCCSLLPGYRLLQKYYTLANIV